LPTYLIDVNLPYYFSLWRGDEYLHQRDLGDAWKDREVWEYARRQNLTIVTKDADFSDRALLAEPPPRVIHLRIGNLEMRGFHRAVAGFARAPGRRCVHGHRPPVLSASEIMCARPETMISVADRMRSVLKSRVSVAELMVAVPKRMRSVSKPRVAVPELMNSVLKRGTGPF
jgi:predicted nuclease of predicted toxin-antitoxin system